MWITQLMLFSILCICWIVALSSLTPSTGHKMHFFDYHVTDWNCSAATSVPLILASVIKILLNIMLKQMQAEMANKTNYLLWFENSFHTIMASSVAFGAMGGQEIAGMLLVAVCLLLYTLSKLRTEVEQNHVYAICASAVCLPVALIVLTLAQKENIAMIITVWIMFTIDAILFLCLNYDQSISLPHIQNYEICITIWSLYSVAILVAVCLLQGLACP